ncbi:hypothetical protein BDR26DRAFT_870091 [Obelidium mucronatum]|nr:hypothetical protein BDR26DRAFT_870091 [Obelidium mucronatum]
MKRIQKTLYTYAHTHCGYYHHPTTTPTFQYNGKDTVTFAICFRTQENALAFQTQFEFLHIMFRGLELFSEIQFFENTFESIIPRRIYLKDYCMEDDKDDDSNPPEILSYQPPDDMVVYQRLEKLAILQFGCEGAQLIPHHICVKKKWDSLDVYENNRLALSRQMRGYVDGLCNGNRPVVKLNFCSADDDDAVDGRFRVVVGVQCLNAEVKAVVEPLLKEDAKQTENPLEFNCHVFVRNKQQFVESLIFKSNETCEIWQELGWV